MNIKKIFFLFTILIIGVFVIKNIETFRNHDNIILIGDSIFKNDTYVKKGNSVTDYLVKNHKNSLILAEDDSKIKNIDSQINKIPDNLNKKSTYVFISVGGNDLLDYALLTNDKNIDVVNEVFEKYEKKILELKKKFKFNLILTNIYYPKTGIFQYYDKTIKLWNSKLEIFANNYKIKLFKIDKLFNNKKYFTNHIEPSNFGSELLSTAILSLE